MRNACQRNSLFACWELAIMWSAGRLSLCDQCCALWACGHSRQFSLWIMKPQSSPQDDLCTHTRLQERRSMQANLISAKCSMKKKTENKSSKQHNKQRKLLCHGIAMQCSAKNRIWNNNATSCLKSLERRQIVNYLHMHVPYTQQIFQSPTKCSEIKAKHSKWEKWVEKLEDKQKKKKVRKWQANNVYKPKVKARCHISCRNLSHFLVFMCVLHRQDLYLRQRINFGPFVWSVHNANIAYVCMCVYLAICVPWHFVMRFKSRETKRMWAQKPIDKNFHNGFSVHTAHKWHIIAR